MNRWMKALILTLAMVGAFMSSMWAYIFYMIMTYSEYTLYEPNSIILATEFISTMFVLGFCLSVFIIALKRGFK